MKTVVRIRRKGKVKDVGRRAMVTVPAAAEVVEVAPDPSTDPKPPLFCLIIILVERHTSDVPRVLARTV